MLDVRHPSLRWLHAHGQTNLWSEGHHHGEDHLGGSRDLWADGEMISLSQVASLSSSVGQSDVVTLRSPPVERSLHLFPSHPRLYMTVASLRVLHTQNLNGRGGSQRNQQGENNGLHVVRSSANPPC